MDLHSAVAALGSLEGSISLGRWGGPGGDPWSFKAAIGISEIIVHENGNIKSISFKDANGFISGTFGGRHPTDRGNEKKIPIQWPSEYLKSISGTYGNYKESLVVTSLSFTTNLTTYGPYGTANGESFSVPMSDSIVVGFYGSASFYLDAIGIYVEPAQSHGSISFGQWGGSGGDPFSFRVASWIKEITVHDGRNIKSISFEDADGHKYGPFGGENPNDPGDEKKIQIDGFSEYLTSITETYGNYNGLTVITSLSFITNLNTRGPFGNNNGTHFSLSIRDGVVNGFHGRGDYYLDAIGIYVKPRHVEEPIAIGPWGGQGGDSWSYITHRGINEIIVHVGANIKSTSLRDTTGSGSATFGGKNPNDIGERKTIHINWPSEHLVSISGTYGNFASILTITSLSFTTNRSTYGPYGTTTGTSFSIPIKNNTVVGFHRRAGHYLDAIGIYVKPETTI